MLQIGMVACNDYILLESCIYRMLQLNLAEHPSYAKLLELFHEVCAPCAASMPGPRHSSLCHTAPQLHTAIRH